jgi:signal transduction histidine kinase/DNA-binding response OmpR family regulator/ligand-binding sensor domain-containing protein
MKLFLVRLKRFLIGFLSIVCTLLILNKQCDGQEIYDVTDFPAKPLYTLNTSNGLPDNFATSAVKDSRGYFWFGTQNGLVKWDGITISVFQHIPGDSTSIAGSSISKNALKYDPGDNLLYIGTENGLSIYDLEAGRFDNYFIDQSGTEKLRSDIKSICIDDNNNIWIGTSKGFSEFSSESGTFQNFSYLQTPADTGIIELASVNSVFDIVQDKYHPGILWIATLEGLIKFDKQSHNMQLFLAKGGQYFRELNLMKKLVAHSDGNIYIGTWNFDLLVFNPKTEKFTNDFGENAPLGDKNFKILPITPFYEKSGHEIWVSSKQGLGVLDIKTDKISFFKTFKNKTGFAYHPILLYSNNTDTWWISSRYGVQYYKKQPFSIRNYFFSPTDIAHWYITNDIVESATSERLYMGYARGEGLHYFNLKTKEFHVIPFVQHGIKEFNIYKILPYGKNTFLFATKDELYRFNELTSEISPLLLPYSGNPNISDIIRDKNGNIWVACKGIGVWQFDPGTLSLTSEINWAEIFSDDAFPNIHRIACDTHGRIWFSRVYGMYGYFIPGTSLVRYFNLPEEQNNINCFCIANDTLWAGTTGNGIGFFDPKNPDKGLITLYNTENGLESNHIESMTRDKQNRFWLLTGAGIECISPGMEKSYVVGKNFNLRFRDTRSENPAFLPGVIYLAANGELVVGYRGGLGFLNIDSIRFVGNEVKPYLSAVSIFDRPVSLDSLITKNNKINLAYNQNYITLSYSALDIDNGNNIVLSHKLQGIDIKWQENDDHTAVYAKLAPGNYVFKVRARQTTGFHGSSTVQYFLHISPPVWETPWAYTVYLLFALLIIFLIYRGLLKRRLNREEIKKLHELDELKSRLYANITHEFRTPLTVIKGVTSEIVENMTKVEQKLCAEKLEMIGRNSDKLLHLVKQMLDMSKIEDGKMKLNLIQDNIVSYLQYVLESFQSMADAKNIKLVFYHETGKVVMDYDQDKIFMIASNLLSNAIKFTPNAGKVIFHVKRESGQENNNLVIKVQDSGIGIEAQHIQQIFDRFYQIDNSSTRKGDGTGIGLALTKDLVELMKGEITVMSTPGERTEFRVTIPITNRAVLQKTKPIKFQPDYTRETTVNLVTDAEDDNGLPLALVVEDNPDVAKYIISCLKGKYRIKWSPDGEQGIDAAINSIPDIIISDVMMPVKDGFEVCETLKQDERTSHIPIILLTAKATETDRIEGLSHGADAYLTKPFNKAELFVRLEQLIKIRRQLQEKYSKVEISLTENEQPQGEEIFLKKTIEAIEKQMDNPQLDPALLAVGLNISESQLYRKLKALSGKSTSVFIRGIRLSVAKKLLESTTLHISEIAYQCGFNNPAWFSRIFKEEFGQSPGQFRKQ